MTEQFDFGSELSIAIGQVADAVDDFGDAIGQFVLCAGKFFGGGFVLVGRDGGFGLLGDAGVFTQIYFGFEDLQDFQNDGWRQAAARTAVTLAFAGSVDKVFGPAIERVGPEFALSDGEA